MDFSLPLKSSPVVRKTHRQMFQLGHILKWAKTENRLLDLLQSAQRGLGPSTLRHRLVSETDGGDRLAADSEGTRRPVIFSRSDPTARLPVFPSPPHPPGPVVVVAA